MSNSIYTYRLSYLTFRDPSRARRGPPLQVLEEKIRYSSHVTVARSQMEQFHLSIIVLDSESIIQLPIALPRIVRQAGFLRRIFRTRGRWCTGASFVFPHLGSTISMGDVRWNIHDSRIVSKRVLNRTLAKLFVRGFFRAGGIGCFQFRDLLRILKGVV